MQKLKHKTSVLIYKSILVGNLYLLFWGEMSLDLFLKRPVLEDLTCFCQENLESSEVAKDLGFDTFASTEF